MPDLKMDNINTKLYRALIVEDDTDICYLLTGILKQKKMASTFVNTLADAMKSLENNIPDITLTRL